MRRKLFVQSVVPAVFVQSSAVPQWSTVNKNSDVDISTTTTNNDTMKMHTGGGGEGGLSSVAMSGTQKVYLRCLVTRVSFKINIGFSNLSWSPYNNDVGSAVGAGCMSTGLYRNPTSPDDGINIMSGDPGGTYNFDIAYNQTAGLAWFRINSGWNDLLVAGRGTQDPATNQGGVSVVNGPWNYIAASSYFATDFIIGLFTDPTGMPSGYSLPPAV